MQTRAMTKGTTALRDPWEFGAVERRSGADGAARLADGLGWFSLGLGLAELLAPRAVAAVIGVRADERNTTTLRAMGARELVTGAGLLTQGHSGWMWARVLGDALDLALLGRALFTARGDRARLAAATASVLGVTWLDARTALELRRGGVTRWRRTDRTARLQAVVTVNRSPEEVYTFWRDFKNLPRFMSHLESIEVHNGHSRWRARAPAGVELTWEAEIVVDRPNELIAWRSLEGGDLPNRGVVRFQSAPGGRGTEVRVELQFEPPGGRIGAAVARLLKEIPEQKLSNDLHRLKQLIETGEVVESDASVEHEPHPARPSPNIGLFSRQV